MTEWFVEPPARAYICPSIYSYLWSKDSRSRARKSSIDNQSSLCVTIYLTYLYSKPLCKVYNKLQQSTKALLQCYNGARLHLAHKLERTPSGRITTSHL